jgi:hypothetical protein
MNNNQANGNSLFIKLNKNDATVWVRRSDISSVLFHEQPSETKLQVMTRNGDCIINVSANKQSQEDRFKKLMSDFEDLKVYLDLKN